MSKENNLTTRTIFMESEHGARGSIKHLCDLYGVHYSSLYKRLRRRYRAMNEAPDEAISEQIGFKVWRVKMTPEERIVSANPRSLGQMRKAEKMRVAAFRALVIPLTRSGGVHRPYY